MQYSCLSVVCAIVYVYFSVVYTNITPFRHAVGWLLLMSTIYFIFTTFTTILNRYQFGKFTSGVQRLWKKTFMFFWVVELGLFAIYYYYFLTSSKEPINFLDLYRTQLDSLVKLDVFYIESLAITLALLLTLLITLKRNFFKYKQLLCIFLLIFGLLFYCLYLETYHIYYIFNSYSSDEWVLKPKNMWLLEDDESAILRVKQQYILVCSIIKFWHFFFVFVNWVFFLLRVFLKKQVNYGLLGYNLQNLFFLYTLGLLMALTHIVIMLKPMYQNIYPQFSMYKGDFIEELLHLNKYFFYKIINLESLYRLINLVCLQLKTVDVVAGDNLIVIEPQNILNTGSSPVDYYIYI